MSEQTKYTTTVRTVQALRGAARDQFQRKRYRRAVASYQQAIHVLSLSRPDTDQEKRELNNLKIKQFVNLAVCYHKLCKPQRVLDMCENVDKIIHINTHCKALFYKGRAYQMLGKLEEALEYYKKALKLEPNNKEIGTLLADIDRKIKKASEDELVMWQRAFNSQPKEKHATYRVDEDFESGVRELCSDLAARTDYTKVRQPVSDTRPSLH